MAQLAVDAAGDPEPSRGQALRVHGIGADGAEAVIRLAAEPLARRALPLAHGEVVAAGAGEHAPALSHHQHQLRLIVDLLRRGQGDCLSVRGQRVR